jgi:hypothetical protein
LERPRFCSRTDPLGMPIGYSFAGTGLGGPVPSISGSFSGSYTPNIAAPIPGPRSPDPSTLNAINLTIGGFTYGLTNTNLTVYTAITGYTFPGTSFSLSGSSNGIVGSGFHDNFHLQIWAPADGHAFVTMFYYATPTSGLFFDEDGNIGRYSVNPVAGVPDAASSIGLFGFTIFGLAAASRISRHLGTGSG